MSLVNQLVRLTSEAIVRFEVANGDKTYRVERQTFSEDAGTIVYDLEGFEEPVPARLVEEA